MRLPNEREAGKWIVRKSNIEQHKVRVVKLKISPERAKMTEKQGQLLKAAVGMQYDKKTPNRSLTQALTAGNSAA